MIRGNSRHSPFRPLRVPAGSAEMQSSLLFQLAVSRGPRFFSSVHENTMFLFAMFKGVRG
jgi:hypothetical protein